LFEPHQPEQCNFKPQIILNIDDVREMKYKVFQVLAAQKHLWPITSAWRSIAARRAAAIAGGPMNVWRGLPAPLSDGPGGARMKRERGCDAQKRDRAFAAIMKMKTRDIAALRRGYEG
jgi:hypothetical protein